MRRFSGAIPRPVRPPSISSKGIHKAYNPTSRIDYYAKVRVLCIDELGYTYHKKEDTDILFQIISKRNEILPTIVTTNLAPKVVGLNLQRYRRIRHPGSIEFQRKVYYL